VGSGGVCTVDDVVEFLSWGLSVQDDAGSAVEAVLDGLDLGVGDIGEAGAFGEVLAAQVKDEVPLTIRFIHSVQKTPVEEFLTVHADGHFHLTGTRYQSHGVGLPFLPEEGQFRREGDYFVLDMERDYPSLSLRTGVGTQLRIEVAYLKERRRLRLQEKMQSKRQGSSTASEENFS